MGSLFNLLPRSTKEGDSLISEKIKKKSAPKPAVRGIKAGGSLIDLIPAIKAYVAKAFFKYLELCEILQDEESITHYIDECLKNGIVSIDTETTSLEPITTTLAGISLYTPNNKAVYIPINHVDYITGMKLDNQVSAEFMQGQIKRLIEAKVKTIMANGKFDIRVLKWQLDLKDTFMSVYWDVIGAAHLLNENEKSHSLKYLYSQYVADEDEDASGYGGIFDKVPFIYVPLKTAYLYAARDAYITFLLYLFQRPFLTADDPICIERDLVGVSYVFHEIEMPIIPVVADMEDTGIYLDLKKAKHLEELYTKQLDERWDDIYKILDTFGADLDAYRKRMGTRNKLPYPVNMKSPDQVAIVLYDILKIEPPDADKPRGTGEEILEQIDHPLAKAILSYREMVKMLSTYITKLPKTVNAKTGRVHSSFNQFGTETGRFSSSDPNLQNIPREAAVRQMFAATPGYVLLSNDYRSQEPRLTAHLSGDKRMIQAFREGRDLYSEIAAIAFNLPYDQCTEFLPDGTKNPPGKERRQASKAVVLGIVYGKGIPAIAKDLKISKERAQEIYDKIMKQFPGLQRLKDESEEMARTKGYVTTVWGRKRRLPDINLPPYEFSVIKGANFDPLADFDEEAEPAPLTQREIDEYTKKLKKCYGWKAREDYIKKLKSQGIMVIDNSGFISQAKRQLVNSRVQGSAGDQTKIAMKLVGTDPRLKAYGFRLLIQVHDELIGECPEENVRMVAPIFKELMIKAAEGLSVPSECDTEITYEWSGKPLHIEF